MKRRDSQLHNAGKEMLSNVGILRNRDSALSQDISKGLAQCVALVFGRKHAGKGSVFLCA